MAYLQFLLVPTFAVMGIAFLFNLMMHRFASSRYRAIAFGVMFGGAIVLSMTNPMTLADGLIFDARSLLVAAATAFVGPLAGAVALVFGIVTRVAIGGTGMLAGVIGLLLSYAIALAFVRWAMPRIKNPYLADSLHGLTLTLSLVSIILLPREVAWSLLTSIVPAFAVIYTIGMCVLGVFFRREILLHEWRTEMEELATRDPLTNLLNRRGLQSLARHRRFDPNVGQAVLYFDVDNFKQVNDRHGHDIGDAVLEVIAGRIGDNLRGGAIFARHGGDEFSIYLPDVGEMDVGGIADRICGLVGNNALSVGGRMISVSISMGAYWTKQNLNLEELIRRADAQLLLVKQSGKNAVRIAYDPQSTLVSVA